MARQTNQVGRDEVDAMNYELRARLTREYHATWRVPGMMTLLRRTPYPMDQETAAGVAALHSDEVISWDDLRVGYAVEWVRDGYLRDGYARGPSLEELEYWTEGSDLSVGEEPTIESLELEIGSTYGIADVGKKEFEAACDELLDLLRDHPAAASAVVLSLPFGGSRPVTVPLVDGVWVSRWALELHEQRSLLVSRGYTLLPALDRHPLAPHRVYPPSTDWSNPSQATEDVIAAVRAEVRDRLTRFPGRTKSVAGIEYIHFSDYDSWSGPVTTGNTRDRRRVEGISVRRWNEWVRRFEDGLPQVGPAVVGVVNTSVTFESGVHYRVVPEQQRKAELALREVALTELWELGHARAPRQQHDHVLSGVQLDIIDALLTEQPQTGDRLEATTNNSRRGVFNGIKGLLSLNPPIIVKCPKPRGYRLAPPPPAPPI